MTYIAQILKNKSLHGRSHLLESVITALRLLSEFREIKTKMGRASEICCKKAWSFPDFRLGRLASEDSGTHI